MNSTRVRGLTVIEVLVVMAVIVVGVGILLPMAARPSCGGSRPLRDSTQVRGVVQALVVWASNNRGQYPLPSLLDEQNATLDQPATSKDTTANILSVMIFNGSVSPEICISPAECNPQVQRFDAYEYSNPSGAKKPADALWDPAFRGTPEDGVSSGGGAAGKAGNNSYAHVLPFGNRRKQWTDSYNSTEAVFGNRGPTFAESDAAPSRAAVGKKGGWTLLPGPLGTQSNTLLIHGGRTTWEGNIGYNDNHVTFETTPTPDSVTLKVPGPLTAGKPGKPVYVLDNLFVNEMDEVDGDGASGGVASGSNAYLRPIAEVASPERPRTWRD